MLMSCDIGGKQTPFGLPVQFHRIYFVVFSCGKYRLLCAKISIAIETFRYVIVW